MSVPAAWRDRLDRLEDDAELARVSPGLDVSVAFVIGGESIAFALRDGCLVASDRPAEITVSAPADAWAKALEFPAPPGFHAFTAWQIANPAFEVDADPAQLGPARAALERVVERALATEPAPQTDRPPRDVSQIEGRLHAVSLDGGLAEIHCDRTLRAPDAPAILFLHTAGADGRQFRDQLADPDLAARYRMYAPDMPFHGRSLPPSDWDGGPYRLTGATYLNWCAAFVEQVIGGPVIVVGGSMGAAITLLLCAERPDLVAGAVAVEPPFRSEGRRNPAQNHVAVHGGLHNSAFVRGLMAPQGPERARRDAAWIYAQGAPGIYPGDLAFYSDEFDGAEVAPRIDAGRTPLALLSGTYDYSATPEDGARLADLIPGARHVVMDGIGHFPMIENPAAFRPHLIAALDHVRPKQQDIP